MKILARAMFLVFMLSCGGDDDDSCTPGTGAEAGATCSADSDCASCNCGPSGDGPRLCVASQS